jgi:hypothetical protein
MRYTDGSIDCKGSVAVNKRLSKALVQGNRILPQVVILGPVFQFGTQCTPNSVFGNLRSHRNKKGPMEVWGQEVE